MFANALNLNTTGSQSVTLIYVDGYKRWWQVIDDSKNRCG